MRSIGVITTSRADYGIYQPVLGALARAADFSLQLFVGGMHMIPEFGNTIEEIERDGYMIADQLDTLLSGDTEESVAVSMGLTTMRFASSLAKNRPDILLVLGDRTEMHAAATAAVPLRIPLAHIHGGEETENAIDNVFRHSLSKLAHLHFTSTSHARKRLIAMGEAPNRVIVSGAPALDRIRELDFLDKDELTARFGFPDGPFVLVTYHPETLDSEGPIPTLSKIWDSISDLKFSAVFTRANADAGGRRINSWLEERCANSRGRAILVSSLGGQAYMSAMKHAEAMVGNSSSGIIEAASFGLPVVNIGNRQKGRERSPNTIDAEGESVSGALERALAPEHRALSQNSPNVYGDGQAAARILEGIRDFLAAGAAIAKPFYEV